MKKRLTALVAGISMIALLVGCGEISNDQITIKKYKGLEVEKIEVVEVTDEDIELSIESDLQTLSTTTEVDRAAQMGDQVIIDYTGKLDGVAFEGGTASDQTIVLGEAGFIDGFEDGIVGHKKGETFDLPLTFPEDYSLNADLAGKAVVFTITLDKVEEIQVPELTDDIVAQLSTTATTVEEYKAQVKEDLRVSNEETAQSQLEEALWEALVENSVVQSYPEDELEEMKTNISNSYYYYAYYYGMEVDEFVETYIGMTIEEMAKTILCQQYAISLIAEKEGLTVSDEAYQEALTEYATQYGYDDTAAFEEEYGADSIKEAVLQDMVMDLLIENCKQVEAATE